MICQKKPVTEESNQATSGSTVFIRWGRSECPADRGTVLVYEGTLVHIYFDYCSNLQNHTNLKGLCIEDIDVLAPEGLLGLIFVGYVPLAFHSLYPIIVYYVANYRPHLNHSLFMYLPYIE